jgi:hypothetical protein
MMLIRVISVPLIFASPLAFADGNLYQPNGNYASIGVGYVTSNSITPPCFGTDCYKTQSGPEASASLQLGILPNLVFGVAESSLTDKETSTTITSSGTSYSIGLIGGFGPFDAGVSYSSLRSTVKICNNGNAVCSSIDDTGTDFGALLKLWLGSRINIGAALDKYSYTTSTSTYISTGYFISWIAARHHSFSLQYSSTVDQNNTLISTGGGVSYSFLF